MKHNNKTPNQPKGSSIFNRVINYLSGVFYPEDILSVAYDSGGRHKPTTLLLHGIAATSKTWEPLISQLDKDNNRIIAIDMLGFGNSPKPKGCKYSVDDHVKYVNNTIKRLKIKKPFKIVGHSMGAIIAARYCHLFPRQASEAYLLSLPYYIDDPASSIVVRKHTDLYIKSYEYIMSNKEFTINNSQLLRKLLRIDDGIDVNEQNWDGFRLSLQNTIIKQDVYSDIKSLKRFQSTLFTVPW